MRLSGKTIDICKLTAPVLEKHSESITSKLYEKLYENYPESKTLFGGAAEDQHKQFTGAIVLYANNIDNIKVLNKSVESMTEKHLKTNIKPEHYPMVKVSLLQAIKDVFGDAANDDVIEAWKEAYYLLGDIVIPREKPLSVST